MSQNFYCLVSLVAMFGLVGCNGSSEPEAPTAEHHEGDGHDHGHAHPTEGPHHGDLIELGAEEYHAELTHDDATHTITIYLLGSDAKTAVSIPVAELTLNLLAQGQPVQVTLVAAPQEGDQTGESSRFTVVDEQAMETLDAPDATGRLNVTIAGKPYSGSIEHHEHGEHQH